MKNVILITVFLLASFFQPKVVFAAPALLSDDFSDPILTSQQWQAQSGSWFGWGVLASNWQIDSGVYKTTITQKNKASITLAGDLAWKDYKIFSNVKSGNGVDQSILFRVKNSGTFYGIDIRSKWDYGGEVYGSGVLLYKWVNGNQTVLANYQYDIHNNEWYRVKTVVNGNVISVEVRDKSGLMSPVSFDYTDDSIDAGKIGLQSWSGQFLEFYPSQTVIKYFDDVIVLDLSSPDPPFVTPIPTPTPDSFPIVFIPGHGGSWNTEDLVKNESNNEWGPVPLYYNEVYGPFLEALRKAGFTEANGNLYRFYYDWRKRVADNSVKLKAYIEDKLVGKPPDTKFKIVAHSMGGLVARDYLERNGSNYVEKLLTVGSPHEGLLETYAGWEGGELWIDDPLRRWIFETPLYINSVKYLTKRQALQKLAPSTLDLFPIFDFLKTESGTIKPSESLQVQNEWLKSSKLWWGSHPELYPFLSIFLGDNFDTLEYIKVKDPSWHDTILGNWVDGKPIGKESSLSGDGSVLRKSSLIGGVSVIEKNLDHAGLFNTELGIASLFTQLDLGTPNTGGLIPKVFHDVLVFVLQSPASLLVIDNQGRKVGLEIEESSIPFADHDPGNQLIVIGDPDSFPYTVEVTGTGSGSFGLLAGHFTEDKTTFQEFEGMTSEGQISTYAFDSPEEGYFTMLNMSSEDYLLQARQRLLLIKSSLGQMNLSDSHKQSLNKQFEAEIKAIDGIISLVQKKQFNKAGVSLEALSIFITTSRGDLFRHYSQKDELYYNTSSGFLDILFDFKEAYDRFDLSVSLQRAREKVKFSNNLLALVDKQLQVLSKKKDLKEQVQVFSSGKEALNQAIVDLNNQEEKRAYFGAYIAQLLLAQSVVLSIL